MDRRHPKISTPHLKFNAAAFGKAAALLGKRRKFKDRTAQTTKKEDTQTKSETAPNRGRIGLERANSKVGSKAIHEHPSISLYTTAELPGKHIKSKTVQTIRK